MARRKRRNRTKVEDIRKILKLRHQEKLSIRQISAHLERLPMIIRPEPRPLSRTLAGDSELQSGYALLSFLAPSLPADSPGPRGLGGNGPRAPEIALAVPKPLDLTKAPYGLKKGGFRISRNERPTYPGINMGAYHGQLPKDLAPWLP